MKQVGMKKVFLFILVFLLLIINATHSYAGIILGRREAAAPSGIDCSEDFSAADTTDIVTYTMFDSKVDSGLKLSIVSNEFVYNADTPSLQAQAIESSCLSDADTEVTIKFDIKFDHINGVDNGSGYICPIVIYDDANAQLQAAFVVSATNYNVARVQAYFYYNTSAGGPAVTMTGIQAGVWYPALCHWKKGVSTGGMTAKIGAWQSATAYNQDNSAKNGPGTIRFGGGSSVSTQWGDGTQDTKVRVRNLEIYKSDQR